MLVSRAALRRSPLGAELMDDARNVTLFNAELLGFFRAVCLELPIDSLRLLKTHRPLFGVFKDPHHRLKRIIVTGSFGFRYDNSRAALAHDGSTPDVRRFQCTFNPSPRPRYP